MIVMVGALAAAAGAGFIALNLANREPEVVEVPADGAPAIETDEVLVAAEDIALGTSLNTARVRWQEWPKNAISDGFMTRSADPEADTKIDKAIARSQIFAGEPIREAKLVRSDRGYMSAILPEGQRAVATNISTETSAGGFILPNDRVDVIMTRRAPEGSDTEFITETVLENIRVLAIDQTVQEKDGEPVVVGETATLQLTPRQAEVLTVAQQMSDRLTMTLRSLQDSKSETSDAAYHLIGGERGSGRIRVIRYGSGSEVTVSQPAADSKASQ